MQVSNNHFGKLKFLKSAEATACFYISMLFYPILASLNKKYRGDEVRIFSLSRDKKVHILCHGGSVKVGVKPKLNFSEKKKPCLFLLHVIHKVKFFS